MTTGAGVAAGDRESEAHPERPVSGFLVLGGIVLALLVVVAVLAPVLAPYDPRALSGGALERPSAHHLLGTNDVGHDIFSELVFGARAALWMAAGAASLAVSLGVLVGLGAGLVGGVVDFVVMRVLDVVLALPVLPLLVLLAALAGPGQAKLLLFVGMITGPGIARIVRSQALSLRQRGFIGAARGFGGGPLYVIRRHLGPALAPVIAVHFVDVASIALSLEAGLAFLGLGDPTAVTWGEVMQRALRHPGLYFTDLWVWWLLPAGLAVTVAVLGFAFVGVGLEPRFNPRVRRLL